MELEDFSFQLPKQLIASFPLKERSLSKLLVVKDKFEDLIFKDLPNILSSNDVLVINDTKVTKARLFGRKQTGTKVEILIERLLTKNRVLIQTKSNSRIKKDDKIFLSENKEVLTFLEKQGDLWLAFFSNSPKKIIEKYGNVPLPPYIKREATSLDTKRYQTVYADPKKKLSVAAPTAGLHFDHKLLEEITSKGTRIAKITLHVGMGSFKPIRDTSIKDHKMHKEFIEINKKAVHQINKARNEGGRVICVGTTSVRCIEAVCQNNKGELRPFKGYTDIFIYPGFKFSLVDALITNFHLPRSTLLLLVSAFGGNENIKLAYEHAVRKKYRFYSYGDVMFVNRNHE